MPPEKPQPKRFNDFAREARPLEGSKVKIDEIINREILITDYKICDSRFEKKDCTKCLTLQFEMEGAKHVLFTGSNVLIDQIEKYRHEIPFLTTLKKIDRYYTFT
jgi:hypothetical protein